MTKGIGDGIWSSWYGGAVSAFAVVYTLSTLGTACNDLCSAVWALLIAASKGKLGDFFRCVKSKPGAIMMFATVVGGSIATTAYVLSIQMAGSIAIPISALCPAVGAIWGWVLFKQKLTGKMMVGVGICVAAAVLIGSTSLGGNVPETVLFGCLVHLLQLWAGGQRVPSQDMERQ